MNKFGERLKELRCVNSLTRANLAEKLNVSVRLIAYWENGQRECNFETLLEISDLFNVSIDFLLGKNDF